MCALEDCFKSPKNGRKYCGYQKDKESCAYKALLLQTKGKQVDKENEVANDIKAAYDYWAC